MHYTDSLYTESAYLPWHHKDACDPQACQKSYSTSNHCHTARVCIVIRPSRDHVGLSSASAQR
eukprot:3381298-Rhodomonas_salina.1